MGNAIAARCLAAVLLACLLLLGGAANGVAQSAYTIRGIKVDVTAEDAVTARTQAMERAQREGMRRLMGQLTADARPGSLPAIDGLDMNRFVRSIDIEEEQLAATRYLATLTVSFDRDEVDRLLQGSTAPVILRPPEPLLVVPVIERGQGPELWAADNPWRNAWRGGNVGLGLIDLRVASGDLLDQAQYRQADFEAGAAESLQGLADRYGAGGAVVVQARPVVEDDGTVSAVDVDLLQRWNWPAPPLDETIAAGPDDDPFALAAERVVDRLERAWKDDNVVRLDRIATLEVRVPLAGLREWVQIRRGMESLPEIRDVAVTMFSQEEATLKLRYVGSREGLLAALAKQGLRLSQELDGWRLQRAAVPDGALRVSYG